MKKTILILTVIASLMLTACTSNDAKTFKNNYESLNGTTNANGKTHRTITIPKDNPIVISTPEEIVSKIVNQESFYVYFGSALCPWCRSVIEKALEVANDNGIDKIYYIDIWDEEGHEILRDKYTLDSNNNPVKEIEGSKEYYQLLTYFDDVLDDYTYEIDENKLSFGEKRIYAPTFIYISKGQATRMTTGISDHQTDSREELTQEMLNDESNMFNDFFLNICDESC